MAHDAEEEAEKTLRREAVIAAVVVAEKIEASDADILEALEPSAERGKTTTQKLFDDLNKNGRLNRLRADLSERQAIEWLVAHAKAVAPGKKPAAKKSAATKADAPDAEKKAPAKKKPATKKAE